MNTVYEYEIEFELKLPSGTRITCTVIEYAYSPTDACMQIALVRQLEGHFERVIRIGPPAAAISAAACESKLMVERMMQRIAELGKGK